MGLDATVMCECFRKGIVKSPPFPANWLIVDEDGYLTLRGDARTPEIELLFDEWEVDCCQHEGMNLASEHLANWTGYRLFQQALDTVGWAQFPVLRHELPEANGGITGSDAAATALAELQTFRDADSVGENAALIDTKTGHVVFEHVAAYEGVFILCGRSGVEVGVGEYEFFVRERNGSDLFRASRFSQRLLDSIDADGADPQRAEFVDLATGFVFHSPAVIRGREIPCSNGPDQGRDARTRFEFPARLHVERQPVRSSDFAYILDPLTRIFEASVRSRNPVRWC